MTPQQRAADLAHIRRCIDACARARDGRGRWRQVIQCAADLRDTSTTSPAIADAAARAAGSFGAWLASRGGAG